MPETPSGERLGTPPLYLLCPCACDKEQESPSVTGTDDHKGNGPHVAVGLRQAPPPRSCGAFYQVNVSKIIRWRVTRQAALCTSVAGQRTQEKGAEH
jgi:hypothetical protein